MKSAMIAWIEWNRAKLRRREAWTRDRLMAHQARSLARLRAFALAHSPFYREFWRGKEDAPLAELPILTKKVLVERFDDLVTDRALKADDLMRYLETDPGDRRFRDRYWVTTTSGSSGRKGIVPCAAPEWAMLVASYRRAAEWTGVRISPFRMTRVAFVNSTTTFHQSARVGRTLATPLIKTCRLDAGDPLPSLVEALNAFQPEVLVAYASMVRILAGEQLHGRLSISPRIVQATAEVLTRETRARAGEAWAMEPFDLYAATETGGLAAECQRHQRLHLFEDLVIAEAVDSEGRPVPHGTTGERLLVTVLSSRTVPLIRYELKDRVRLNAGACPCGRPFHTIDAIEGRALDVFDLAGHDQATVSIHPAVFVRVLDALDISAWQVWHEDDGLRIMIVPNNPPIEPSRLVASIQQSVREAGAAEIPIRVEEVEQIPPGPSGKRPLIIRR